MGSEMQEIYQLRFWLAKISPLIWRRFLVNATSTIRYMDKSCSITASFNHNLIVFAGAKIRCQSYSEQLILRGGHFNK
jgi:hypothetical protein